MTSEVDSGGPPSQQDLNHKFFTSQIDDEVAGFNERGVKAPQVRIPGKTHLSGVLLIANPWEDRDLDRKLTKIKRERIQKERTLEWNQRQFFINQIFDQDLNLRFNKLLLEDKNKQQARDLAPEFNQYYYSRDNVPSEHGGRTVTRPGEAGGQVFYPVTSPGTETRNTALNYEATYRSMDEAVNQVTMEDHNTGSGTGRSSMKTKGKKPEKKATTASMGIFAPPLNLKPKTKLQRERLINRHTQPTDYSPMEVETDVLVERIEIKSAMSETTDVPVTANDTNKEANLKLTLPVLVPAVERPLENVAEGEGNKGSRTEETEQNSATENRLKDTVYLTADEPSEEAEEGENEPEKEDKEEQEETKISTPETQTKSRLGFERTHVVVLPDIRINNYTVPSPIQEEDEDRRSSVTIEEERTQSVSKKLGSEAKEKPKPELKLHLPVDLLRSEPVTPSAPSARSTVGNTAVATNRTATDRYEPQALSREDTRLSSRLFTNNSNQGDAFDDNQSETSSATSRQSSGLLEDDVITRLTRTLPETLMIKANQSINKIIDRRKQRMLRKARDYSSRNTMEDPRWRNLTSALTDKYVSSD